MEDSNDEKTEEALAPPPQVEVKEDTTIADEKTIQESALNIDISSTGPDSVIEMEVDDSNTGDTITSNPEIDLGSAAAAATAVIVEQPDCLDGEGPVIQIQDGRMFVAHHKGSSSSLQPQLSEEFSRFPDDSLSRGRDEIADTPAEPDVIVNTTEPDVFDCGQQVGFNDPLMDPESDYVMESDQDPAFLQEESAASVPEDAVETDKENNLGLAEPEDSNDDQTFLEIRRRISQDRDGNCYCGKDRNFNIAELLCVSCNRWFHESCISYQLGKLVPFITNYVFTCKNCSPTGLECFKRNQAQFSQMCVTALANLMQASVKDGTNIRKFSKDKDIIPFFEMHWEALTTTTRRVTQSWHSTVTKTLIKDAGTVYTYHEIPNDSNSPYFGLLSDDLTQIRPNYEAMIKTGQLRISDSRNLSSSLRGRGNKRRTVTDQTVSAQNNGGVSKKPRGDVVGPKPTMIGYGYPTEHPFNKDSYRYILAEPDPNAPFRQEFDESNEWSGKPIHGWLCRIVNPPAVLLALHDRAPQLKVSEDRLSVTGEKGYCMIRATHGVNRGAWYFEAKITDMPEGSAVRIGFSQQFGNLQGPLGFDRYGYSWRSRYGTVFHEARGKSYAKGGYGLDDVLGFLIILPEEDNIPLVPTSFKDRPLVKVKSHLYYEDKDDPKELERRDVRKGSKIICYKNGVCQGIAFQDIFCGTYYPAVSLYKSITVRVNFGPDFEAPPVDTEYRGMFEKAECSIIEQTMADMLYLTENEGKLRLDNAVPKPV